MKFEDIEICNYEYKVTCIKCGAVKSLFTQADDDNPEYRTSVYLECSCGEYLEFILPVN